MQNKMRKKIKLNKIKSLTGNCQLLLFFYFFFIFIGFSVWFCITLYQYCAGIEYFLHASAKSASLQTYGKDWFQHFIFNLIAWEGFLF